MVTKTVTITEDAYHAIKRLKQGDESFSDLFLRLGTHQLTAKDIVGILKHTPEEDRIYKERVLKLHEELGEGLQKRLDDVRTRFKRAY